MSRMDLHLSALLLAVAAGCKSESHPSRMEMRDSAGVVIVDHGPALPSPLEQWALDSAPILTIGGSGHDEDNLFTRVVFVGSLRQGEIAVADGSTNDIRVFDPEGKFLRRIGRLGGGPGEFRSLSSVSVTPSRSITVTDLALRRISVFSPDGELQRTLELRSPDGGSPGVVLAHFADASFLARRLVGYALDPAKAPSGLMRDTIELFLLSPDGSSTKILGRYLGDQKIRVMSPTRVASERAPFGLRTVMAAGDSGFYLSTQERFEIREYRQDGRLKRVIRRGVPLRAVDPGAKAEVRRQWDTRFAKPKNLPPQVTELPKYLTFPDFYPSHGEILLDRAGNLWVEDYRPFSAVDTITHWTVFSADGAIRARAQLPKFEVTEIGVDRVIGVLHDTDGAPIVLVHRLSKRGG